MPDTTHQVKDSSGNVVDEIELDPAEGPYTVVEKPVGGDGGGGPGEENKQA